jgi:hypothetical protein
MGKKEFPMLVNTGKNPLTEKEVKIIMKDFGEISGAAYILKTRKEFTGVRFPVGNEPIIDYYVKNKDGLDIQFSAKANEGSKPSIGALLPEFEVIQKKSNDTTKKKAAKALTLISTEQKGALYQGPLLAAEYLDLPGYKELIKLLKNKKYQSGYSSGIPDSSHLETAVANMGGFENFLESVDAFYTAAGFKANMRKDKMVLLFDKGYKKSKYGLLHFPITSELIRWLNNEKNKAKDVLNSSANTLKVSQLYLRKSSSSYYYEVKEFSDAKFTFETPSGVARPTNNRIGFKMKF